MFMDATLEHGKRPGNKEWQRQHDELIPHSPPSVLMRVGGDGEVDSEAEPRKEGWEKGILTLILISHYCQIVN